MKQSESFSYLFEGLNDLKSFFGQGQKLVSIIQNLLDFMEETAPVIENINRSIIESTNRMPSAAKQIKNITSATELATTEILDMIDLIVNDIKSIDEAVKSIENKEPGEDALINKLKSLPLPAEALEVLNEYTADKEVKNAARNISELTGKIKQNTNNISISLQVQDITSQQLSAVNHLIHSVKDKLSSLVQNIQESRISEFECADSYLPEDINFDPNAIYSKSGDRQTIADAIINKHSKATSQDEIDKLFS